jgi:hypothetical protein
VSARFKPLILVYNHFASWGPPTRHDCPAACEFTMDRGRLAEADAAVYHIPTLPADTRRIEKRPGQKAVALSLESEGNYPLLADPEFMGQFDITMTYRRDATIWCAYFDPDLAVRLLTPPQPKTEAAPAVYFTSNPFERSGRNLYVIKLMKRIGVDCYGRMLRNRELREDRGRETKLTVIARYKFTLAFENSICRDYVTEKFFDPLVAGSVPVYLGAPNVNEFAPAEDCFIDVTNFAGPAALAAYLASLAADERAYARYLAWKTGDLAPGFLDQVEHQRVSGWCRLCLMLRNISPRAAA